MTLLKNALAVKYTPNRKIFRFQQDQLDLLFLWCLIVGGRLVQKGPTALFSIGWPPQTVI